MSESGSKFHSWWSSPLVMVRRSCSGSFSNNDCTTMAEYVSWSHQVVPRPGAWSRRSRTRLEASVHLVRYRWALCSWGLWCAFFGWQSFFHNFSLAAPSLLYNLLTQGQIQLSPTVLAWSEGLANMKIYRRRSKSHYLSIALSKEYQNSCHSTMLPPNLEFRQPTRKGAVGGDDHRAWCSCSSTEGLDDDGGGSFGTFLASSFPMADNRNFTSNCSLLVSCTSMDISS